MQTISFAHRRPAQIAALALLILAANLSLWAGPATNDTAAATNSPAVKIESGPGVPPPFVEPPVPLATFVMPKGPADGKDPFFPRSTSPYGVTAPTNTKKGPAPVVAELVLQGMSGSEQQPLVIINTITFGVGDELDVPTKAGKLRIHCLEINKAAGTATVQMGAERRELRLPGAK